MHNLVLARELIGSNPALLPLILLCFLIVVLLISVVIASRYKQKRSSAPRTPPTIVGYDVVFHCANCGYKIQQARYSDEKRAGQHSGVSNSQPYCPRCFLTPTEAKRAVKAKSK